MKIVSLILLFCVLTLTGFTQTKPKKRAGSMFFTWGWNGASYTRSTIQMKGADYNLTLKKVRAFDKHTEISYYNYLKIDRITIPQTNTRLGYFIKNNVAVILGIDHMKYVIRQNQTVNINGVITKNGDFKGNYNGPTVLTDNFLTFEHTDGLNYVHAGLEKYYTIKTKLKTNKVKLEYILGADVGVLIPKTNVKFLDYERTDRYHVSGAGAALKFALQGTFFKHLFFRMEGKVGYINMPDIILHKTGIPGRAKQNFGFIQGNGQFGYLFKF